MSCLDNNPKILNVLLRIVFPSSNLKTCNPRHILNPNAIWSSEGTLMDESQGQANVNGS